MAMEKNGATILILEDDESIRDILKSVLSSGSCCKIHSTWCADKALTLLKKDKVDIILLDIELTDTDGLEILKKIKRNKMTEYTEVIIITMEDNYDLIAQCLEAGAFWYLNMDSLVQINFLVKRAIQYQNMLEGNGQRN